MISLFFALAVAQDAPVEAPADADEAVETEAAGAPVRSSPPAVIPAEFIELDELTSYDLGGGRVAWHVRVPGVRKVSVEVTQWSGTYAMDQWPTPMANYAMDIADVAAGGWDAESFEILQDVHDMMLYSWISDHRGGVTLQLPREDLALGMEAVGAILRSPAFPKKEVKQWVREDLIELTVWAPTDMRQVSYAALDHAWYPADHILGARPDLDAMKKVKAGDLVDKQQSWRQTGPVTILVVGDVAWEEVELMVSDAVEGIGTTAERSPELAFAPPSASRVVAVDMPGQKQTALRLAYAAPPRFHEDAVAFGAMNWALGGHFLSRLNANLREEKGFTYGAGSGYTRSRQAGRLTVRVDVKAENTAAAVTEIEREITRLVEGGVTAEELDMAARSTMAWWNGTRETARSASGFYSQVLAYEETVAARLERVQSSEELTPEDVQKVAEAWLGETPSVWVVVGDRSAIEGQLDELGWEVEWITTNQAILGTF